MERVAQKMEQRAAALSEKHRLRKEGSESAAQLAERVLAELQRKREEVEVQLGEAKAMSERSAREALFRSLIDDIRTFQRRLGSLAAQLPAYDAHKAQSLLSALEQRVRGRKTVLLPRQPFSFDAARRKMAEMRAEKRKQQQKSNSKGGAAEKLEIAESDDDRGAAEDAVVAAVECSIKERDGEQIVVDAASHGGMTDISLEQLRDCNVNIRVALRALQLRSLHNCTVTCGVVSGSVMLHEGRDCTISAMAQQVRIHESSGCTFHLLVNSGPIIEASSELRFSGAYVERCDNWSVVKAQAESAGLSALAQQPAQYNKCGEVKDFDWLREERSTNWEWIGE